MNKPEKTITGDHKPHFIAPRILSRGAWKNHYKVFSLKPSADDSIVMWTDGAVSTGGYEAGTHDGLRDGSLSAKTDMSNNYLHYCLLSDWLAAGNPQPEE